MLIADGGVYFNWAEGTESFETYLWDTYLKLLVRYEGFMMGHTAGLHLDPQSSILAMHCVVPIHAYQLSSAGMGHTLSR